MTRPNLGVLFVALVTSISCARAQVSSGIETLTRDGFTAITGTRVGLVTNPTGVNARLESTVDILANAKNVNLVALFGPEHGVRGEVSAGDHVDDFRDPRTGLPVRSLYGATRKPTPAMLADIDTLVFDIQDIGSRSYTYISTLAVVMEAAAENGKRVVVLDRPNPLGGERIEGRPLNLAFRSFVGHLPITYVHGMTVGELARMINGERWLDGERTCDLTVIPLRGWTRSMIWEDTGLPWVPTSPHIPHPRSAWFYAATGIMGELGVISEGVGIPLPFELSGRPGINANALADNLNARGLAGVSFRPMYFRPYYGRFAKKDCGGVQIVINDWRRVALTPLQFHIMDAVRELEPDVELFGNGRDAMFDKVCGTDQIREAIASKAPLRDVLRKWSENVDTFRKQREPYLLYD